MESKGRRITFILRPKQRQFDAILLGFHNNANTIHFYCKDATHVDSVMGVDKRVETVTGTFTTTPLGISPQTRHSKYHPNA
jgi:hypothetical protein